jgi:hypothetical protein
MPGLSVGSGAVRAAWDAEALYLAFGVSDEFLVAASGRGEDGLWDGDGVEVMLSTSAQRGSIAGASDFHIIVGVDGRISDARGWTDYSFASGASAAVDLEGASLSLGIASGYRVELRIPWAPLGVTPAEGLELGFDVAVNNRMDPSAGAASRDWSKLDSFNNPAGWGTLILGKESAGSAPDAGASADAGANFDAEIVFGDAGASGSLGADAGIPGAFSDAGGSSAIDAAAVLPLVKGACGCSPGGGWALGTALLALGALIPTRAGRRRR